MQHIDLLSSFGHQNSVGAFAKEVFCMLDAENYEERESVSYEGGSYFIAETKDVTIKVSLSGDDEHSDLPCWIQVYSNTLSLSELTDTVDGAVHGRMLPGGFQVARMFNFGRKDEQRVDYRVGSR